MRDSSITALAQAVTVEDLEVSPWGVEECARMAAVFERPVDVRWRDTDALGHVNHVVFLTYLEEGRDAFYTRAIGSEPSYVVVHIELDLRAEVRYEDRRVTVQIAVEQLGTTSLTTRETV